MRNITTAPPFSVEEFDLTKAYDLASLGYLLGCSAQQLGYYIYKREPSTQYKQFHIKKKSGGKRTISSPSTNLKIIQKNLARNLSKLMRLRPCVTGFVKGRDIKRNASTHVGQRYVLNIDLEDFFGTINYGRVYGLLTKKPYNIAPSVAAAISKACILNNSLPQGAPTSPVISNLICAKMDAELSRYAATNKCTYSRYADDLTFSSNRQTMSLASYEFGPENVPMTHLASSLRAIIESNGFKINEKKVRLTTRDRRQIVTGLVVNKRVNVRRSYIREVRAMLHAWEKFDLTGAQKVFEEKFAGNHLDFDSVLRGKIGFIGQIRGRSDDVFRRLALQFNELTISAKIRVALNDREISEQAVWVIEHDGDTQGSVFFLRGIGLVTCRHCLGENAYIYHPANHTKHFPVKVIAEDVHRDLAVLEVPKDLKSVIPLVLYQGRTPNNGADITLLGYPNHFSATPVRIEEGKLIRTRVRSAVSYLEISSKIIGGNSGGPVLNDRSEVIGVAVLGMNGSIEMKNAEFLAVNSAEILKAFPSFGISE